MRILFMGRKQTAARCLEWLITQGHTVVGVLTDHHLDGSPTAAYADTLGLPLMTLREALEDVRDGRLKFDLGVSVVYWRIIPEDLIDVASRGIINFHPAPLPDFKGAAGYNLAILEGLSQWGITAHYIDAGVDTGPIIEVDRFSIDPESETAQSLEATSMTHMVEQFQRVIESAAGCNARLPTTPNIGGRHVSRREMEAMKLIISGDDVDRKIRAFWFPPYSGATLVIDGKPYTVINQQILNSLTRDDSDTSLLTKPPLPRHTDGASK